MIFYGSQNFISDKSYFGSKSAHRIRQLSSKNIISIKVFEKWCKNEFDINLTNEQRGRVSRNMGHSTVLFLKALYELEHADERSYSIMINQGSTVNFEPDMLLNYRDWRLVETTGKYRNHEFAVYEYANGNRLYTKNYASNLFDRAFIHKILREKDRVYNKFADLQFHNLIIDF